MRAGESKDTGGTTGVLFLNVAISVEMWKLFWSLVEGVIANREIAVANVKTWYPVTLQTC